MLKNWAFFFLSPGYDPATHRHVMDNGQTKVTLIGMDFSKREQVVALARELVASGTQMIELCGGFGPLYIAKIKEATGHAIPVGSTMYGPEDRQPMLDLLKA
jgi:hypothetical protein